MSYHFQPAADEAQAADPQAQVPTQAPQAPAPLQTPQDLVPLQAPQEHKPRRSRSRRG